jgi:threonylcarbamoyladenosine tRNA methylthiotransferase MtaB
MSDAANRPGGATTKQKSGDAANRPGGATTKRRNGDAANRPGGTTTIKMRETEVVTFGCRLNTFESQVIRQNAEAAGLGDAIIINTCAVTAEAERQARQAIRRARRQRPDARIIVTGCSVQTDPETYAAMPEVDQILGNAEKLDPKAWLKTTARQVDDIGRATIGENPLIERIEGRARAILQVQNGCDHACTFCIIPSARGPSRSVPGAAIIDQARKLAANGFREFVLTGVDITAYGGDLAGQPKLGDMVARLLGEVPEIERLRLSSLDVSEVDPVLVGLIATEPRIMPHLHLSLQAGDDMVLKRMKRRHTRDQAIQFCAALRALRPEMTFGADLIVGFPTETGGQFQNTLALVDDCGLTFLHVFPYSVRRDTPAGRMPQVPDPVRKDRVAQLRARGDAALAAHLLARRGSEAVILVERATASGATGHAEDFSSVLLDGDVGVGDIVRATVTGVEGARLLAQASH